MVMRPLTLLPLVASLLGQAVAEPRVVPMTIHRREQRGAFSKRSGAEPVSVVNAESYSLYYVDATVGSPPQKVKLQIDTGSSDVWMFGTAACNDVQCYGGSFDQQSSSSFVAIGQPGLFEIQYVTPGSGVSGDYFADNFGLGSDLQLKNLTMAVATKAAAVFTGIMGIGFDADESIYGNSRGQVEYHGIIDVMVSEGVIPSHSYSLFLDDLEASTGTVLFGGYDTAKFHEPLTVLDIQVDSQSGIIDSFTVVWSFLGVTDSKGTTLVNTGSFPLPAVLDSGTTLTVVPAGIFQQLATYFNATNEGANEGYLVPCSNANWEGTLDYGFGGDNNAVIQVPFSELALPAYDQDGYPATFNDGTPACAFGIAPTQPNSPILLGDTFLRSAYVIYDIEAKQVGIAQTNYNATSSSIKEIAAGTDLASILGSVATPATSVSVTQTATGQPGPIGANATATLVNPGLGPTGGVSSVNGVKTTLALATTLTPGIGGGGSGSGGSGSGGSGSGSGGSGGSSSSSKAAAAALYSPTSHELPLLVGTLFTLFAGGAAVMAFF